MPPRIPAAVLLGIVALLLCSPVATAAPGRLSLKRPPWLTAPSHVDRTRAARVSTSRTDAAPAELPATGMDLVIELSAAAGLLAVGVAGMHGGLRRR